MRFVLVLLLLLLPGCSDSTPSGADAAVGSDATHGDAGSGDAPAPPDADAAAGDDGAASDGGGADSVDPCAPRAPTPTRARFAALVAAVNGAADAAARQAKVDAFLAALGDDYPLRDAKGVVIVSDVAQSAVAGSFNNWTPTAMTRLSDTTLFYAELDIGAAEASYKLVQGSEWSRDARNRHVTWDGIPRAGVGAFNSVVPAFGASGAGSAKGRLEVRRVESTALANTRDVFVYLPPGYDAERCTRYPLLLVNDGNESLTRSHFDQVTDATLAAKRAEPLVIAFVALADQNDRLAEYGTVPSSRGAAYVDFLCDTLVPALETRYQLSSDRTARAAIGASLGGLSALNALVSRNDCLSRAGSQSGSFWYEDEALIKRAQSGPLLAVDKIYLDNGSDNRDSTIKMRDVLVARGYSVVHREDLGQGHTWDAWADRFDEALEQLFPRKTSAP
ncbi:MAG: alpha/beta hydrolase [Myxococcales bacterium]|nr:alpha/beta hydrolase [Myxococcales bacterium]